MVTIVGDGQSGKIGLIATELWDLLVIAYTPNLRPLNLLSSWYLGLFYRKQPGRDMTIPTTIYWGIRESFS